MGLLFLNTTGDEEEKEQDREENQDSKDSDTTPRSEESSSAVEVSISKGQCKLFFPHVFIFNLLCLDVLLLHLCILNTKPKLLAIFMRTVDHNCEL